MKIKRVFCSILSLMLTFTAISSTLTFSNNQSAEAATASVYNFNYGSGISWPSTEPLPTFSTPADTVDVVNIRNASLSWKYTILSLQGIVNAKQPRILISYEDGRNDWINDVVDCAKNYITINSRDDIANLINKYRSEINGIVYYDDRAFYEHSANVALSVAGAEKCIVSDEANAWFLMDKGYVTNPLSVKVDLSLKFGTGAASAYTWLYNNYYKTGKLNKRLLVTLSPTDHATHFSDYAVATKSAILWLDPEKTEEAKVLDLFFNQATVGVTYNMGWWPDEDPGVCYATKKGVSTIPSDFYENASFYSGQSKNIEINDVPKKPDLQNKMYIALAFADGDNTQYNQGTMKGHWESRKRLDSSIPINWTVSPALYYTGPQLYDYFNRTATGNDMLICGPSGLGYTKSTRWRTKSGFLSKYLSDTNIAFEKTGINIITIWDRISAAVYDIYAANLPSLLGSTVNNNAFNDMDSSNADSMYHYGFKYFPENGSYEFYNDRPIFGLGPKSGYLRTTDEALSDIKGKMANFNEKSPRFVFKQFVPWDVNPRQVISMAQELKETYGDKIEFVRADHFFMLINEANNLPYNLALSKGVTATASSTKDSSTAKAIDGTFTTGWTANTTGQSWYQLDFGERCEISRYTLKNAQTGYYASTQNTKAYKFEYSLDGTNWFTADSVSNNTKSILYRTLSNTVAARYVRVNITDAGYDKTARIQDLEVYGTKLGITNNSAPVTATRVKVTASKSTMNIGDTAKLTAVVSPANATNRSVTYRSSNSSALSIDQNGNIKAVTVTKPTDVTLTATTKDGTNKSASVTITVRTGKVESLKLSASKKTLNIGKKFTVKATVSPTTAKNKAVKWSTSSKKIATVNSNGVITAKAPGIAKITAKAKDGSGKKATITITVKPKKITNVSVKKVSSKSAKITFKKQKNITKYEIYSKKGNGKWKKIATTNKTSYTVKKLTKKVKYSFKVRSYKKSSSKKVYGDFSKAKTLKLK